MDEDLRRNNRSVFFLVLTAIMTALTTVATVIIVVPFPTSSGYLNFGDALVLLSGMLLGPFGGFFAGGVGSAAADVTLGYTHFAPITLIVKGLEGLVIGFFSYRARKISHLGIQDVIGLVLASLAMLTGYLLAEIPLVGLEAALAELLTVNLIQVTVGSIIAALIGPKLREFTGSLTPGQNGSLEWAEEAPPQSVANE